MNPTEIKNHIEKSFPESIIDFDPECLEPWISIHVHKFRSIAEYLRQTEELHFESLMCLSGMDYKDQLGVVYHFHSYKNDHRIAIKVFLSTEQPNISTISDIWRTAEWHEREAYDLFGIKFDNNPDLRRILLPDDWEGYPLRKDYQDPKTYNEMPVLYEGP